MSKKKISTEQSGGSISNPLANAFAGLDLPSLPEAVPQPALAPVVQKSPPGTLRIRRSTAHRGGKCVIVVDEFPASLREEKIVHLASALRKACSTGGTCKDRVIEIQGELLDKVRTFLQSEGWRVKG